jgi:hypothetical protein
VTYMRDALPPQLAAILAARRGCPVAWTVSARNGATARFTADELVPTAPVEQDIAVVLVGVNDALRLNIVASDEVAHLANHDRGGGDPSSTPRAWTAGGNVILLALCVLAAIGRWPS